MRSFALALVIVGLAGTQATPARPVDPTGKWSFSTVSDTGDPLTGTLAISGTPGTYAGEATVSDGTVVPISDVMTSPAGFMAVVDLPQGAGIFRLKRGADGKFSGAWALIAQSFTITAERIGGDPAPGPATSR
jgi:hypothetical protein